MDTYDDSEGAEVNNLIKIMCATLMVSYAFSTIDVVTTVLPLKEFVEKVGGKYVKVTNLIPPGANPHTYEPSPKQLRIVSKAQLIVKVGAGFQFEHVWLPKLLGINRQVQVCNSSIGIEKIMMDENHHHENDHERSETDPHVWLSLQNAVKMINQILISLKGLDPENAETYEVNADRFTSQIKGLQSELETLKENSTVTSFLVFHPAWGYFANEFNLEQHAIEMDGKEPSPRQLIRVIKEARKENIKTIFIEPQYNKKAAKTIAREIGAKVVEINPLAANYIKNMKRVAIAIFGEQ